MTMTHTFSNTERNAFEARGFTVGDVAAHIEGMMTVDAVEHGHWHFQFTITLPNGSQVCGFVPKTEIVPPMCEDISAWKR
jgi:hypothetical protein